MIQLLSFNPIFLPDKFEESAVVVAAECCGDFQSIYDRLWVSHIWTILLNLSVKYKKKRTIKLMES